MRITRTDDPAKGGKHSEPQAKAVAGTKVDSDQPPEKTIEELQRELNALTGRRVLSRDRTVLNRMIAKLAKRQADAAGAPSEAPSLTKQLVAIANMKLPALRDEYQRIFGKPSLSRSRKALLLRIASKLQEDAAAPESPTAPLAKPTLTVKFERKGGKKAGGKAKGRPKAKPASQGKETATKRTTTRIAGQRDPRLPKPGTTITREWHGKKYLVRVLESGFEYDGKPYRSLSALAKHITGQIVNGYAWFRVGLPGKEKKSA